MVLHLNLTQRVGALLLLCVDMCPMEIFSLDGDKIVTDHEDECTLCEVCVDMCPNDCITIKDE